MCEYASDRDKSITATLEQSSEEDEEEENKDAIIDLIDMEQANQIEGTAGFQSHRHFLGKEHQIRPQLMSD